MFNYLHKVQYYETDQMGIVHHSNYIRWFEEARTEWMETIGFSYARMEEEGVVVPVLSVNCDYKQMTKYGETAEIQLTISSFTGVRINLSYQVRDKETKELRATGETSHAFLNEENRPISLKRKYPAIYQLIQQQMTPEK